MKSDFKRTLLLLLFLSNSLFAREIILIENQASQEEGLLLQRILINKFHLPKELITLKNIKQNCEVRSEAIIHLCLLSNGDLQVKKMNQYVVQNSLGVFLNQEDKEEGN